MAASKRNASSKHSHLENDYTDIVELWVLRMLLDLGGHRDFIQKNGFRRDRLAHYFQVECLEKELDAGFDAGKPLSILRKRYRVLKAKRPTLNSGPLFTNLHWLGKKLALSSAEIKVLAFRTLLSEFAELEEAADTLGELGRNRLSSYLAIVLGIHREKMREALRFDSQLVRSGLIRIDRPSAYNITNTLEICLVRKIRG